MNDQRPVRRFNTSAKRHGFVLVAVLVLFAVCLTLIGVWTTAGLRGRQRVANQQFRLQAIRLAEAGVGRAIVRRASDPAYQEETWTVPATELDGSHAGEVRIRITPADDTATLRCEATAVFPAGAVRHAEITKRIDISNSPTEVEP